MCLALGYWTLLPQSCCHATDRQLDEGNRNMAAAAQMSDLKPLPGGQRAGAGEHTGQHRDMIEKVRCARTSREQWIVDESGDPHWRGFTVACLCMFAGEANGG